MSGSDPMFSLNVNLDSIIPGGVDEVNLLDLEIMPEFRFVNTEKFRGPGGDRLSLMKSLPKASGSSRDPLPIHRAQDPSGCHWNGR